MAAGFVAGLGAATADAAYGAVAGFGLTAVSGFLIGEKFWIGLFGGAFLCYLGVRSFLSRPASEAAPERGAGLAGTYASTLLLTLANPATILSFAVIFAAFGLGATIDYAAASSLVAGVFAGSALWWLLLSGCFGLLRKRVSPAWMQAVNRLSGAVLIAFGIYAFLRV
jgi:threonine/homoserine/homoserine lactone efflux protein